MKDGNHDENGGIGQSMREDTNGRSYCDTVLGRKIGLGREEGSDAEEIEGEEVDDGEGMKNLIQSIGDTIETDVGKEGCDKYHRSRVGKTVKVDKNTLTQERGKYARLCVQVNLTEPLLAMFTIKGRKYNIEYEGLHLLCLTCGKFGHYKEGCPDKSLNVGHQEEGSRSNQNEVCTNGLAGCGVDRPWRVVRNRRGVGSLDQQEIM
ncbi:hypothetical protein TSUD_320060 [Trifolium subterraneum]|uniref:CCHC-type domain-containing protein n=1 Tax=Trifolium subterraneum TaxID=3900 RepID=A0A2Z6N162_TRISU|nr:hypothetical protein TSUD_320060 [Trifolium subterraneum]